MEGVGRVVIKDDLALGSEDELLPILKGHLVSLIQIQQIPLAASNLLWLVKGYKLNQVAIEPILAAGLIMMLLPVHIHSPKYLKEVTHHRCS